MKQDIVLNVNGIQYNINIETHRTLVEVLRDTLGLTGTKKSCNEGECGACTVLMDGKPVASCQVLAVAAQGKEITTIEGLAQGEKLHPVQEAFVKHTAIQCGFCTPGMILTAKAILDEEPHATEDEIKHKMAGNLCRCTGYKKIVEAVMSVTTSSGKEV